MMLLLSFMWYVAIHANRHFPSWAEVTPCCNYITFRSSKNQSCSLHINWFVCFTPPERSARIISTEGFAIARYIKPFNCAQTLQSFKMHLERLIAKENPSVAIRHETPLLAWAVPGLQIAWGWEGVWELSLCLLLLERRNWADWPFAWPGVAACVFSLLYLLIF